MGLEYTTLTGKGKEEPEPVHAPRWSRATTVTDPLILPSDCLEYRVKHIRRRQHACRKRSQLRATHGPGASPNMVCPACRVCYNPLSISIFYGGNHNTE